jgi:quaternary ammonium compound-resistance protein SugE
VHWIYLLLAGLFEIGWPLGLKLAGKPGMQVGGIALAVVSMSASGALLWLALKGIPIGTAYAVWTGIGAAGTFLVGVWFFGDPSSLLRYVGVAMIVGGVIVLKMASVAS